MKPASRSILTPLEAEAPNLVHVSSGWMTCLNMEQMHRALMNQRKTDSTIVSQEILSRPDNKEKPLQDQDFVELRIDDWTRSCSHGFTVTEWRIRWSEADHQFMWEDEQQEQWTSLEAAMNRYEWRRRSLRDQGFSHSDMDY